MYTTNNSKQLGFITIECRGNEYTLPTRDAYASVVIGSCVRQLTSNGREQRTSISHGDILNATATRKTNGDTRVIVSITNSDPTAIKCVVRFLKIQEHMIAIKDPYAPNRPLQQSFEEIVPQEEFRRFMKDMSKDLFWGVIQAAQDLKIEKLRELCCLHLLFLLVGKSEKEMNDILDRKEYPVETTAGSSFSAPVFQDRSWSVTNPLLSDEVRDRWQPFDYHPKRKAPLEQVGPSARRKPTPPGRAVQAPMDNAVVGYTGATAV